MYICFFQIRAYCAILLDDPCIPRYTPPMIKSFTHKGLSKFFETGSTAGIQPKHAAKLRLILTALDSAEAIGNMDLPGLRLHSLKGNLKGKWSVTVNGNWRIIFEFENGDAYVVDYLDYH